MEKEIKKVLNINENISVDMVDKVINVYNEILPQKDEKIIIYISSLGGDFSAMELMINLINNYSKNTILIGYNVLASCAFELFFKVRCKKYLTDSCVGMYHQSTISIDINEKGKLRYKEDKAKEKFMIDYMFKNTYALCNELGFTKEELKKIKNDEDVWFQPKRMKEFLCVSV